jgi:hypothetical protein
VAKIGDLRESAQRSEKILETAKSLDSMAVRMSEHAFERQRERHIPQDLIKEGPMTALAGSRQSLESRMLRNGHVRFGDRGGKTQSGCASCVPKDELPSILSDQSN